MNSHLSKLYQFIITHYDLEELRTLCFNLSIPFDNLRGEGRSSKARELILQMGRRHRLDQIVAWLRQTRPNLLDRVGLSTDPATLDAFYVELPAFEASASPSPQQAVGSHIAQANRGGTAIVGDGSLAQVIKANHGSIVQDIIQMIVSSQVTGDVHIGDKIFTLSNLEELNECLARVIAATKCRCTSSSSVLQPYLITHSNSSTLSRLTRPTSGYSSAI